MGWLNRFRLNHAARRYALKLPTALVEGWGGSETYTPEQIRVAVAKTRLPPADIAIAFAAYLPEKAYIELATQMPRLWPYDRARAAFFDNVPPKLTGDTFEPPPLRLDH